MGVPAEEMLTFIAGLFAIVNPIGVIPIYASYAMGLPKKLKSVLARRTVVVATGILIVFAIFGYYIFTVFGITYASFRIAGGLLLFKIGFDKLHGRLPRTKYTEEEAKELLEREDVAITPLATPLVAGPGAITTVVIGFYSQSNLYWRGWVLLSIVIVMSITYFTLLYSERLLARLGRTGVLAIHRVMGLLITAISVEMILKGVEMWFQIVR